MLELLELRELLIQEEVAVQGATLVMVVQEVQVLS
jgi:hypothetical protein